MASFRTTFVHVPQAFAVPEKLSSDGLIKNAQMQGARGFSLPVRQAILKVASRRIRSDFLPRRRVGEPAEAYFEVRRNDEG